MRLLLAGVVGLVVLGAASPRAAATQGFVVVVHADNPATNIDHERLSNIFLKRVITWPNGNPVEPVDLAPTDRSRAAFTKAVLGKSVNAVRAFWQQQIFSGRDIPPPEKGSETDVIEFVKTHPGAVGYVSGSADLGAGVKALPIDGAKP